MGTTTHIPLAPSPGKTLLTKPSPQDSASARRWPLSHALLIFGLWFAIFAASIATPPLLDDADATHAQAAQAMLRTGDLVTPHVDGIRYLEKAPLPYWIAALSLRLFGGRPAFAIHLPLALTVLGLALLGYVWSRRAFGPSHHGNNAPLYTAIFTLTSAGVFLFTRVFIPDALLSLLLAFTLFALLRALEPTAEPRTPNLNFPTNQDSFHPSTNPGGPFMRSVIAHRWGPQIAWPYAMWIALALAVLTKGLVALVFFFGATAIFLFCTRQLRNWRRLRPFSGILLLIAIAAPWHILAGLRNTGGANGHGFFWFYLVNEHFLRFLGRRIPRDYNKLPGYLYWSLHLVWLFPWSLFAPAAILYGWRKRRERLSLRDRNSAGVPLSRLDLLNASKARRGSPAFSSFPPTFAGRTVLLLLIFSALVLVFFSLSTNQEYYTFPVYLPLLMLLAAALSGIETDSLAIAPGLVIAPSRALPRALTFSFATLTLLGLAIAAALAYGLWSARHLPFVPDIGALLAHRSVGDYTLSMSHFFDLTGPSFAALRLPATLAALTFAIGPGIAWRLYARRACSRGSLLASLLSIAFTGAIFLIAAHIALVRFSPMLSSESFAATIQSLERSGRVSPHARVLIYGDQAFGSSIPFYLSQPTGPARRVYLVDGRTTSMLFGSTFPDAPKIFLTHQQLLAEWGSGPRKLLFVPLEQRASVDHLLGPNQILLQETSGKSLITDRPLDTPSRLPQR
jgi:4-amino-4-deoxy-L-arabinose transferase-like glycosyltransferase